MIEVGENKKWDDGEVVLKADWYGLRWSFCDS